MLDYTSIKVRHINNSFFFNRFIRYFEEPFKANVMAPKRKIVLVVEVKQKFKKFKNFKIDCKLRYKKYAHSRFFSKKEIKSAKVSFPKRTRNSKVLNPHNVKNYTA